MGKPTKEVRPLTPPDPERCQAERLEGSFMTLGPRSYRRCDHRPVVIAQEIEPADDGQIGSMSLCAGCLTVFAGREDRRPVRFIEVEDYVKNRGPAERVARIRNLLVPLRELTEAARADLTETESEDDLVNDAEEALEQILEELQLLETSM